ncbi:hypothetical protein EQU50_03440 [Candidatus Finniella inopinata]|uniref:Toprim domain-containing protein n=2 Tax=Candidatus Finniella inopinata TaxID=1696036 RepID=A0A4Q7DKG6_9PROT|nr:hypothetical protein EQU50_03440 [Candidatus Finniella inopinata]
MTNPNWLDFNDAAPQSFIVPNHEQKLSVEMLKQRLHNQLTTVLVHLFPYGRIRQPHFVIGNVQGDAGESLKVELTGPKIGMWHDFATGEGGDILSLWGAAKGWDHRHEFPEIVSSIHEWLGMPLGMDTYSPGNTLQPPYQPPLSQTTSGSYEELGAPTDSWKYEDAKGNLLACVYRYDTPKGKQFRPWDVKTRAFKTPDPRPLYNQRGMINSETVIVVEGEKCAQTLIDLGICATTAMNGAKAPLDKTDWSPLHGKHMIIWPDHDTVGQEYADRLVIKLKTLGITSLSKVVIPDDKPESWDAADAFEEGVDIDALLQAQTQPIDLTIANTEETLPSATAGEVMTDRTPSPQDWIAPRILTPGGLLVLGGAPKVGKTDMILSWLAHMAAGLPFLGMIPPRPLKIFYLQTEIMRPYLRERLQNLKFDPNFLPLLHKNLVVTFQVRLLLNEDGVNKVYETVKRFFKPEEVDILVIDPLRNVYDAGKSGSENDNMAMLAFLQDRVEKLRAMLNPTMGVILTHHTKKVTKAMVEEDPFQALSGAGSLRSFYTTGMLLFKADEKQSVRNLMFELRNGEAIQAKLVDKIDGTWQEMSFNCERIVQKEYGAKLDAERHRRHDVILQLIFDEAREGRLYTPAQFREAFEGHAGLGGERTIHNRLSVLATKGYIKFNKDKAIAMGIKSKYGIMCVEDMEIPTNMEEVDIDTGEVLPIMQPVLPTHFKESQSGAILPVENPDVWVYLD